VSVIVGNQLNGQVLHTKDYTTARLGGAWSLLLSEEPAVQCGMSRAPWMTGSMRMPSSRGSYSTRKLPTGKHTRARFLHGAACNGCLLIAETPSEQQNDFLDRALVVPTVDNLGFAFFGAGWP